MLAFWHQSIAILLTCLNFDQELLAYEEMKELSSELCQKMQMRLFNILLQDVYITKDSHLEKSRILIKKGKALRACGTEGLKDCIDCFSEAISAIVSSIFPFFLCSCFLLIFRTFGVKFFALLGVGFVIDMKYSLIQNDSNGGTCSHDIPVCHQLAVSYCLRALCIQEAEPTSKVASN